MAFEALGGAGHLALLLGLFPFKAEGSRVLGLGV